MDKTRKAERTVVKKYLRNIFIILSSGIVKV